MKLQELKFRIFNNLINNYDGFLYENVEFKGKLTGEVVAILPLERDYLEIELFTGFADKYGDKIYEGDIVTIDCIKLLVVFEKGSFVLKHYNKPIIGDIPLGTLYNIQEQDGVDDIKLRCVEILGNMRENPELLEDMEED